MKLSDINIKKVKIEICTPEEYVKPITEALTKLGACKVGNYDFVVSYSDTKGYWRPLEESNPYNGEKNQVSFGSEVKMEVRCDVNLIDKAIKTIKKIHPYEEPVINIVPLLNDLYNLN